MRTGKWGTTGVLRVKEDGKAEEEEEKEEDDTPAVVAHEAAWPLLILLGADNSNKENGEALFRKACRKRSMRKGLAKTKAFGTHA
jgi:hypothetical protein|eukprot:evm.model.NODE_13667_length_9612_cov_17.590200.5